MPGFMPGPPTHGSLAWATDQVARLSDQDERRNTKRLQTIQEEAPMIEEEVLPAPPIDPNRFPPGLWRRVPGVMPKYVLPDHDYQGDRPRGSKPAIRGQWQYELRPPEWEFNTPSIDPRLRPGWSDRMPVFCDDPDNPGGSVRPCHWVRPPITGPIPPSGPR